LTSSRGATDADVEAVADARVCSISCICSGVSDATSAASVAGAMWPMDSGACCGSDSCGGAGSGAWLAERGMLFGGSGTILGCIRAVGGGGGASLPLLRTHIPIR
jgi:hypothetical protein